MSDKRNEWRFETAWRERDRLGAQRDYARTFEFTDGNAAARMHDASRRGRWMQPGMEDGWISDLRKYEIDGNDSRARRHLVAVIQKGGDVSASVAGSDSEWTQRCIQISQRLNAEAAA